MPTVYGYARASTQPWLDLQIGKLRAAGCERVFSDIRISTELGEGWPSLCSSHRRATRSAWPT
jgi:hypothetical protein